MTKQYLFGAVIALFLITFICYYLGVSGPFLLDDFSNFKRLEYVDGTLNGYLLAIFNNTGEILNRPVSYASFLLNFNDWPNNPAGFKRINLMLHVLCGLALLACLHQIPWKDAIAKNTFVVFLLGFWLLSPLNVSTVLYAVQRMTLLSALFGLLAIFFYLRARTATTRSSSFVNVILVGIFSGLSFLSKENGILVLALISLLHLFLRRNSTFPSSRFLDHVAIGFALLVLVLMAYLFYISIDAYYARPFTFTERLILQGKILADYAYLSILPNISYMSLHHDGYEYFTSATLVTSGLIWLLHFIIIGCAIKFWQRKPIAAFGIFWFYIAHLVESTFVPLELMFEHRNYFPAIGIYIALSSLLVSVGKRVSFKTYWMKPLVFSVPLVIFSILLAYRSAIWQSHFALATKWAAFKKDSARAQYLMAAELEQAGMLSMAYGKIKDDAEKFNRLGFYLFAYRLQCKLEELPEKDRIDFPGSEKIKKINHTSEVNFQLNKILQLWLSGECIPDGYTNASVDNFLQSVIDMPSLDKKPNYEAQILVSIGDFYTELGSYNQTNEVWKKLYDVQPTVDNAIRIVDFAISFELYDYAEEYLNKAVEINNTIPWIAADQSALLAKYRNRITSARHKQKLRNSREHDS